MRQIKITYGEDEANKTIREIMQKQGKIIAMRPFTWSDADPATKTGYLMHAGIAIEYDEQ